MSTKFGVAQGRLIFCPKCTPSLATLPKPASKEHYSRAFGNGRNVDVFEGETHLTHVEEYCGADTLQGGAMLTEFVREKGQFVICRYHPGTPLRSMRFSPTARIVKH